eukprot:TRINITY_DN57532_c0_g1_i1.p1 TRINITY_DN57532_c0_g1~~TRINITY_DN57532_c0_g1_i1.p1  ORF type:complete len:645 (+),score=99.82 TRINITY_DN57532_c0_g1_i1:41-1936(+)
MPTPKRERIGNLDLDGGNHGISHGHSGVLRVLRDELGKQNLVFEEATQRILTRLDSLQGDQQEQHQVLKRNLTLAVVSALDERSQKRLQGLRIRNGLEEVKPPSTADSLEELREQASLCSVDERQVIIPGQIPEEPQLLSEPITGPRIGTVPCPDASPRQLEDGGDTPKADGGDTPKASSVTEKRKSVQSLAWDGESSDAKMKQSNMSFRDLKAMYGLKERTRTRPLEDGDSVGWYRRVCMRICNHGRFEPVCSTVMILCAVQIACEAHDSMHEVKFEPQLLFRILDIAFNIIFTLELLLRWSADGFCFFFSPSNPSVKWNAFDFVLVAPTWLQELIAALMTAGDGGVDLQFMRLLRMMRLVRVARIIRVVRFFSELRVMVNCILGSGRSLLWAFLLLCLVMFTIGVVIMQFSAMYIDSENAEKEVVVSLRELYGNLFRTMVTLFMVISGGIDWRDAVTPLRKVSDGPLELLMCFYVFFTTFCCLNIVTGIFVDNAKSLRQADEEAVFQEAMQERKRWIAEVADLFAKLGNGTTGEHEGFGFDQFKEQLGDIRVQTIFRKLGINPDTTSAEELWEILDADGSGNIDQEEFADGIKHFHGDAKNIDVYRLSRDLGKLTKRINRMAAVLIDED